MHFTPTFVTTVASLSATSRLALGLRVRGVTGTTTTARAVRGIGCTARKASTSSASTEGCLNESGGGGETCVVSAALAFLEGKKKIVEGLSPADFAAVDASIGASVGAHMRHSLDHFSKCLSVSTPAGTDPTHAGADGTIRYDHRVRGGSVETDPAEAAKVIASLLAQVQALPRGDAGSLALRRTPVAPTFMLGVGGGGGDGGGGGGGGGEEHTFESNLERELFFCCHHGIHHDAMIQLILGNMGQKGSAVLSEAGKGFGVAPSTADFRQKQENEGEGRQGSSTS